MIKAFLPGTFDPPTLGHIDLIHRASQICAQLVVGIGDNPAKLTPLFSSEERIALLKQCLTATNIVFVAYHSLTVECIQQFEINCMIRGLRSSIDFENEYQLFLANQKLNPNIETLFIPTLPKYLHISSSLIRQIAHFRHRLTDFVPANIEPIVYERLTKKF